MSTTLTLICLKCPHRGDDCGNGPCACTKSGQDIIVHIRARQCPVGRFDGIKLPAPGLGDRVESLLAKVGGDHLKKLYTEVTGKPCGCNARKAWLNAFGEAGFAGRMKMLRGLLKAQPDRSS